ncbi:DNA-binding protein WhiA [Candidatus Epulonipiscium fishelsonii]|uniref:DNA-binding protein WhiA n=1 Tax=Candidatus Epulonipiscium fishelsonii TaxID=77094 RepID=A0ACC8XF39_9FIRM|nr:DNA-binding protein WhiA [Epulopiscium sp. SCG-B05WGA-EpuloA1]ONI41892.1 DNA-binding protein WhiA [Epulopiscium sp. SCG-B11WGA-EpuloA1]ONI48039.1 DNA-binding protein WhiA [Epulopiscium sp. SCG-C06WGA-EpuloA1]
MTFSSRVKEEILNLPQVDHCNIAEIIGFVSMVGNIDLTKSQITSKFNRENQLLQKKYFTFIEKYFNISSKILTTDIGFENLLEIIDRKNNINNNELILKICCKKAYLRGAFLGGGYVNNPKKSYHLEFVTNIIHQAQFLQNIMLNFDLYAKIIDRKNNFVVYLKEGSQIVDLLNLIGAHISLMEFENIRIVKEVRNNINRLVNCETSNLKKTISASVNQIKDIQYIEQAIGLSSLDPHLEIIAKCRLNQPNATLQELGNMLTPPIGKSGANHRLKKISNIAKQLQNKKER